LPAPRWMQSSLRIIILLSTTPNYLDKRTVRTASTCGEPSALGVSVSGHQLMQKVIKSIRLCCDRSVYLSLLTSTVKYHVFCSLSINKNLCLSGSPIAAATLRFMMDEGILWNRFRGSRQRESGQPARRIGSGVALIPNTPKEAATSEGNGQAGRCE
jgi:hypothetical protein